MESRSVTARTMDLESHHVNPVDGAEPLNPFVALTEGKQPIDSLTPADPESAITKAEKIERQGGYEVDGGDPPRPTKRIKLEDDVGGDDQLSSAQSERVKGIAPIKAE